MSNKFRKNDEVFVPASRIDKLKDWPYSLYRTNVTHTRNKSIKVRLPNGEESEYFGSSCAHTNTGIIIITIGDIASESTLLEPLRKSVLQFSRLLLPDDCILSLFCRSFEEFEKLWDYYSCSYSYLILIGHGSQNGITFAVSDEIEATELKDTFDKSSCPPKHIISLCCKTGYKNFGHNISQSNKCIDFIAPFQSIHGAEASQFVQTYLIKHLLEGKSSKVAFKNSNALFASKNKFRMWVNGKHIK
jgi:hypothetical protein